MSEDTISRQAVLDALQKHFNPTGAELSPDLASVLAGVGVVINTMPSSPSRPSWIPCSERLNDLIFDINPAEICAQIEADNLKKWCEIIQVEMKLAMVQLPCWSSEDGEADDKT